MKNLITPDTDVCLPQKIKYTEGNVKAPENILSQNQTATVITYEKNGKKPFLCLDFGPSSPGGYPVFEVESFTGEPRLRIAYADWYDYICDPLYRETGDFRRGTCKYLGPELPVLPANPNRFELYQICRTGIYCYPLIQGQQRFVLLSLDTPGTSVSIRSYYIYYTSSRQPYPGTFRSSMPALDYLWDASIYTLQLATLSNSQSLEILNQNLFVRALTKGRDAGLLKQGVHWRDYTVTMYAELPLQPDCINSFGWVVRAKDSEHFYIFRLSLNGELSFSARCGGSCRELAPRKSIGHPLQANQVYKITVRVEGNCFFVSVNDEKEIAFSDNLYAEGTIGFCQTHETWAIVKSYSVTAPDGSPLFSENFANGLDAYDFTSSPTFVADGAKRDRLPWTGDLYWAGENSHYSFGNYRPMHNTLELFRRHQCPDGFVWGVCYPENDQYPVRLDYGMYQSDVFSAWFIIVVMYEYLFNGDTDFLHHFYPSVALDAEYLWNQVDGTGLFYQRYETSKGLWDHFLNDYGYYAYNNMIIIKAFQCAAVLAEAAGRSDDAEKYAIRSKSVLQKAMQLLWDEEKGAFCKGIKNRDICYLGTAFAFAFGMIPQNSAGKTVQTMCELQKKEFQTGKNVILFLKGCFKYGFADTAFSILTGSTGTLDYHGSCVLNWIDAVRDPKGPACTTECMPYSHDRIADGACWNDSSHPDTGVAFLMSSYILGIRPVEAGFRKFRFSPNLCGLNHVEGTVPTPYGNIYTSVMIDESGVLHADLSFPEKIQPDILIQEQDRETAVINLHPFSEMPSDSSFQII